MKFFVLLAVFLVAVLFAQNEDQQLTSQSETGAALKIEKEINNEDNNYIELSRPEIDKIEKECETLFQNGTNLNELAKKASDDREIDKCLGILINKEFTLQAAIIETCKLWMQCHNDPKEKILLRKWIKNLQNKYPEEIYPLYVELVNNIFENDKDPDLENIDKIISGCDGREQNHKYQELKNMENGVLLSELGLYLFVLGAEIKAFTINEMALEFLRKTNAQQNQETPLDILRFILLQQENKLVEIIENKQTDYQTLISASDTVLPLQSEKVLKIITERISKAALQSNTKLEFAKLFWRGNQIPEYEKLIKPLIKSSNINACIWDDKVKKLLTGVPANVSKSSLVRLVFPLGTGSGFFISEEGIIATAAHNFALNKRNPFVVKIYDENKIKLTPLKIYIDPIYDLALIQIKEKPKSYFSILEEEPKSGSIVHSIGFPLNGTQSYFQSLKVIASFPEASDILLTGDILRGMSGGPVIFSNKVIGVNSTSLGPTKAKYIQKGLAFLKQLKDDESNTSSDNLENNLLCNPKTIWANYLDEYFANQEEVIEIPDIYESPRSLSAFFKKVNREQFQKILNNSTSTFYIIKKEIGDDNGKIKDTVAKLKEKNILREYPDYIEAHKVFQDTETGLKKILEYNPEFSPALGELSFYSFLEAVGKKEEYQELNLINKKGNFQIYTKEIKNKKAFAVALDYMKKYWDTDPNLRWEFLPNKDGVDIILKMYFTLKKTGPFLIAQADGPISDEKLREFAQQGNTLAMAFLAERLISEKDSLKGYMFAIQAAESGEPKGQSILAFYLLSGTVAAKNENKGFEMAMKSAEAGDPRGNTIAGICLIQGIGTTPDKTKGMELIQNGIKGGDSTALEIAKNPGMENRIQFIAPQSSTNSH